MNLTTPTKLADIAVAASLPSWFALHAAGISLAIQWLGGLAVIVASFAAAYYHIKAARRMK